MPRSIKSPQLIEQQKACLAILNAWPALQPNQPTVWDLTGSLRFLKEGYQILFLDKAAAEAVKPYWNLKFDELKLVNSQRPAIRLSFFSKHKYFLNKAESLTPEKKKSEIVHYLEVLDRKRNEIIQNDTGGQFLFDDSSNRLKIDKALRELQQEYDQWQHILEQIDDYDMAISNYYFNYTYWYVNYKFVEQVDPITGEAIHFASENAHLLSPQRDPDDYHTIVKTKLNVVFVDLEAITDQHDYQNKEIEDYLASFETRTKIRSAFRNSSTSGQLFVRPRAETNP